MTRDSCAYACMVRAYAERERATLHTCMCMAHVMGHKHVHADGHSRHVVVECVRADCLFISCPGAST